MPVMQVSMIQFKLYISEPLISNMHRQLQQTNSKYDISVFKLTTGISNLRKHLFSFHIDQWVTCCDDLKISITAKDALAAVRKFRDEPPETSMESEHPEYTKEGFVEALLEFVIGDDLVCAS
jgi:hypothetical protein